METILVIAILTNIVSIFALVINILLTRSENKKRRNIDVVTKQTIDNFVLMRSNAAKLSALTNPEIIKNEKSNKDYKKEVLFLAMNIEYDLIYLYEQEVEILDTMRNLIKTAFDFYDTDNENLVRKICVIGEKFRDLFSIYNYADWLYIKNQTVSGKRSQAISGEHKYMGSFDSIYKQLIPRFENSIKPRNPFFHQKTSINKRIKK